MKAVSSEKLFKFDPNVIFKRFRVCRIHFEKDCFNGECKKLLHTAVPSIHLANSHSRSKTKFLEYEGKVLNLLNMNSVNADENSLELITLSEHREHEDTMTSKYLMNDQEIIDLKNEDDFMLMEVVNEHENRSEFTIVMPNNDITIPSSTPKVLNYQASTIIAKTQAQPSTKLRIAKKQVGKAPKKFSIGKLKVTE